MKTVILTFKLRVPDETPDDLAIESAIEQCQQNRSWPDDDDITIEHEPPKPNPA